MKCRNKKCDNNGNYEHENFCQNCFYDLIRIREINKKFEKEKRENELA